MKEESNYERYQKTLQEFVTAHKNFTDKTKQYDELLAKYNKM